MPKMSKEGQNYAFQQIHKINFTNNVNRGTLWRHEPMGKSLLSITGKRLGFRYYDRQFRFSAIKTHLKTHSQTLVSLFLFSIFENANHPCLVPSLEENFGEIKIRKYKFTPKSTLLLTPFGHSLNCYPL